MNAQSTLPCLAGLLGAVLASNASAQFTPLAADNVNVGTQPSGLAFGDFDGDGDVDQATTVDGPDRIVILLNDGSGGFSVGGSSLLPNSSSPQDVIAGDFDGDLDMDLAVALRDPSGSVQIMINNGSGSFSIGGSAAVGDRPRGLSTADHDGDGDLDIAVANRDGNSASVLTNNGTGSFSVQTLAVGGETRATVMADLVGGADLDLAVTNADGRSVSIFQNTGGSFSFSTSLSVGPIVRPDGITAADLDGDTDADLAVAVSDQTTGINSAAIFVNGAGFTGPFNYATGGTNTSSIAAADLDCDGVMDLATANADSNNVSLLRNLGGAVFGTAQLVAVQTSPDDIIATDLDGDQDPDIAVANQDSNSVSTIINDTCEEPVPCPWDVSGDGSVAVTDLLTLLGDWGPNPGSPSDFDGSGVVDTVDLLALLGNWGTCP